LQNLEFFYIYRPTININWMVYLKW